MSVDRKTELKAIRLLEALEAVMADHQPRRRATHTGCRECGQLWPCSTARIVTTALDETKGPKT